MSKGATIKDAAEELADLARDLTPGAVAWVPIFNTESGRVLRVVPDAIKTLGAGQIVASKDVRRFLWENRKVGWASSPDAAVWAAYYDGVWTLGLGVALPRGAGLVEGLMDPEE